MEPYKKVDDSVNLRQRIRNNLHNHLPHNEMDETISERSTTDTYLNHYLIPFSTIYV